MSHHVSASPTNPTGAVEVVRTSSPAAATAPVDTGSAGAGSNTPVSTVVGAQPAAPGQSGTPGANLPVDDIQQASNTIQNAENDLTRTAGAERRLDGFDLVGGGGGGGGNADAAVAAGTDGKDVSESGEGGNTDAGKAVMDSRANTELGGPVSEPNALPNASQKG